MPTLTKKRCLRLIGLIEAGQYFRAAEVLERAFDWDDVPPGRAYWEGVHRKFRQLTGEDGVTVIRRCDPQSWERVPIKNFFEALPTIRKK
jgi:hypothetical protein